MGYIGLGLIKIILQLLSYIGDGTIWIFKKLFLAINYLVRFCYFITELPFIIVRSLYTTVRFIWQFVCTSTKRIRLSPFLLFKDLFPKRRKKNRHSIGRSA